MKFLLSALLMALALPLSSQNLVPNGGFESYTSCPTSLGQVNRLNNWFLPASQSGSTDFHHACGGSLVGVPSNLFGNQAAHTGSGYCGQYFGYQQAPNQNYREYAQVQLTTPLQAGITYRVEAYVSMPDNVLYNADRYGFHFSNIPLVGQNNQFHIPVIPQVESVGTFFTNTTGWDLIGGTFVATGGEQYLTIGNFRDFTLTGIQPSGLSASVQNPYIYVDDVSVTVEIVLQADYQYLEAELIGDQNELRWKTNAEENITSFKVERSEDGRDFVEIGEVEAGTPGGEYVYYSTGDENQVTQYFRLKAQDQEGMMHISEVAVLKGEDQRSQVTTSPSFLSAGQTISLGVTAQPGDLVEYSLMDMAGKSLQQETTVLQNDYEMIQFTPNSMRPGVYLVRVLVAGEVHNTRILIQ